METVGGSAEKRLMPEAAATTRRVRDVTVGLGAGAVVIACLANFGVDAEALVAAFFAVVLVVLAAIDLEKRIIPNRIVLPATAVVLAANIALQPSSTLEWLLASLGAGLFFLLPLLVYPQGMGMGDVKLALLLGAGLGTTVVTALLVGLSAGFLFAVGILIRSGRAGRGRMIAFGPFLALGGLVALFFG